MRISDWSSDVCSSDLDGENRLVGDSLRHMGVDRVGEIHTLQHLVAILQLAELATRQFHRDAFCRHLFNARDRRIDHPAAIAFITIGPADPFAFMHLDPLFIAELQPIKLARGVNLDGLDAMLLPAHRSEEHTSELQSLMRISYA